MSQQRRVLEALHAIIDTLGAYAPVHMGAMPAADGIAMAVTAGREVTRTLAQERTITLDVTLNAKHSNQAAALDALCRIHEALAHLAALPSGEGWQVINIRTGSAPACLGREETQWLYGSALAVTYTDA